MTPEQQELMHRAVVDAIIANGSPVDQGDTSWGWLDPGYAELRVHMAHCLPAYDQCTWDDSEWTECEETFDPGVSRQGIDLKLTCRCGLLTGRTWRYTDGHAALIRAVTGG